MHPQMMILLVILMLVILMPMRVLKMPLLKMEVLKMPVLKMAVMAQLPLQMRQRPMMRSRKRRRTSSQLWSRKQNKTPRRTRKPQVTLHLLPKKLLQRLSQRKKVS